MFAMKHKFQNWCNDDNDNDNDDEKGAHCCRAKERRRQINGAPGHFMTNGKCIFVSTDDFCSCTENHRILITNCEKKKRTKKS